MSTDNKKYFGIRDIARIAGVSTATVSRVINSPDSTSENIRKKVMAVIEEYNYVPNQMAKNLFSKTSNSIAIFVYDMENPFFTSLVKKLNNIAFKNKYTLLICDTENNIDKEREYLNYCKSIRTSGIILTEGVNYDLYSSDSQLTIACLDRSADTRFSTVRSNNVKGIKLLIDYLYNLNHRKIAFAGAMDAFQTATERKNSYIDSLKSHHMTIHESYIFTGHFNYETGVKALNYFWSLNEKPTAIVCANDQIAKGLIMEAYKLNISVPDDLSVVGFDGIASTYFYPKITTIEQDIKKIAKTLFKSITTKSSTPIHEIIDVSIIIGESCKKIDLD
ncbi:LacI family DNA-binding transcriptional regulator [Vallitalea pronyensis]|uniref:LacI family DNA-binding transcriptional regulator n=1 Tax=Vallitalea pronyensis TaxID=1348613 RepID=A0A8J8MJ70_9FIRM|nr:LacI family DNA-binding transcriptional regulator [Vallitalea pronyensis]QUI22564.1 LacI family DNA-binding transcriptional regulator [Vallitalea pronyensis]